jgi:hypothetical protein
MRDGKTTKEQQDNIEIAELLTDAEIATMMREMAEEDVIYLAEVIVNVDEDGKEISLARVLRAQNWVAENV